MTRLGGLYRLLRRATPSQVGSPTRRAPRRPAGHLVGLAATLSITAAAAVATYRDGPAAGLLVGLGLASLALLAAGLANL